MCHPWQSQGKHTAQCCDPFRVGTKGEGLLRSTDLAGNFQVICSWELCWDLGSGMSKENSFSFNTVVFIFSLGFSHLGLHARHIGRYCIHKIVPDSAVAHLSKLWTHLSRLWVRGRKWHTLPCKKTRRSEIKGIFLGKKRIIQENGSKMLCEIMCAWLEH